MFAYILKRILSAIPVVIGISIVSFIIIQLPPGDFATTYQDFLVNQAHMTTADAERLADQYRAQYGLDKPVSTQYFLWVKGLVTEGKFGYSFAYKKDVSALFAERLWRTFILAFVAHFISTVIGVLIGVYSATHQYKAGDNAATFFSFLGMAAPRFFLGICAMYFMLFALKVPDVGGWASPEFVMAPFSFAKFLNVVRHTWPVVAIAGFGGIARNLRVMRGNLLDVLNMQYVTTARSKGLKESAVIYKHAVPNALHSLIMYQGTVLPYMLQGELEVAIVLSVPTLAPLFYNSLQQNDIYVAGGCLMIYAILLVVGNLIADFVLALVDPRVRLS
jgi:peptide/nickel transport system permease protein